MEKDEYIQKKLNDFLNSRKLKVSDLSQEELSGLRSDYESEYNGFPVLDGWEHSISPYRCFEKNSNCE